MLRWLLERFGFASDSTLLGGSVEFWISNGVVLLSAVVCAQFGGLAALISLLSNSIAVSFQLALVLMLVGWRIYRRLWRNVEPIIRCSTSAHLNPLLNVEDTDKPSVTATLPTTSCCQTAVVDSKPLWTDNCQGKTDRSIDECLLLLASKDEKSSVTDGDILNLLDRKKLNLHQLESVLGDDTRAVHIRRLWLSEKSKCDSLKTVPFLNYDYSFITGSCCENVVGYIPMPLGFAGPIMVDGRNYFIPLATTEGCLVASTSRGCKAVSMGSGVRTCVINDGMTRGPVVRFPGITDSGALKKWLEKPENFKVVKEYFDGTSRFARLTDIHCSIAGRLVFLRFHATTGDAMGMNMVSKGTEEALLMLQKMYFPRMEIVSLSGNFCTDKKPAAINWIEGRGKSVVCEATIPGNVIRDVLKTSVEALVDLNISKNLIGSAVAGTLGGNNAHSSNIVTAIFLATGQDAAQNISSSNCLTQLEPKGDDLYMTCTMPSLEVGTVGGGTILPPQKACLELLGCAGSNVANPGRNAEQFARIVCATVLAGELSLLSALSSGHLVRSHMKHNRSYANLRDVCVSSSLDSLSGLPERSGRLVDKSLKSSNLHPESCSKVIT